MSVAARPDYQLTPLGWLPLDWEVQRLSALTKSYAGGTPDRSKSDYFEGDIPWVKSGEVNLRKITKTEEHISEIALSKSSAKLAESGSVLVAMYGATAGKVARLKIDAAINQAVLSIRSVGDALDNDFLFWVMESSAEKLLSMCQGAAQPNLSKGLIDGLEIATPPLPEQQKIATILTAVDDKLDVIARQIEATQTLKQGLMQTLFSRGVGTQDADGRWVPHAEFKESELGTIPQAWRVCQLQDISEFITKGGTPTTYGFDWVSPNDGIPFFRSECVTGQGFNSKGMNFIHHEAHRQMARSEVRPGDVLMTITGNIGRVARAPSEYATANINQHIARVRINDGDAEYVYQCLKQDFYAKHYGAILTGQAYPQISLKQVRETPIVLAPLLEQKQIARVLADADFKTALLKRKLAALQTLKRGLMQKLLTGEWRVSVDACAAEA